MNEKSCKANPKVTRSRSSALGLSTKRLIELQKKLVYTVQKQEFEALCHRRSGFLPFSKLEDKRSV